MRRHTYLLPLAALAILFATRCSKAPEPPYHPLAAAGPLPAAGSWGSLISYTDAGYPYLVTPPDAGYPNWTGSAYAWTPLSQVASVTSGLSTGLPAATGSGHLYLSTDIPTFYFDSPVSFTWQQFSSEYLPYAPGVVAGNYSTPNNLLLLSQRGYAIQAVNPYTSQGSTSMSPALVSGTFNTTSAWWVNLVASANWTDSTNYSPSICLCLTNGTTSGTSTGRMVYTFMNPAHTIGWEVDSFTIGQTTSTSSVCSPNSGVNGWPGLIFGDGKFRARILSDGTYVHYQESGDNFYWIDFCSETPPNNFTQYGFFIGQTQGESPNFAQALVYENASGTPTQYSVSNVTISGTTFTATIGSNTIVPGDVVAVHGVNGNSGVNSPSGGVALGGGWAVLSETSTTITCQASSVGGSYTSGGTVTLLSR